MEQTNAKPKKKIASIIVAAVMILASLIIALATGKSVVEAGAGSGSNAKVKDVEQLSDVLSSISGDVYYGDEETYPSLTYTEESVLQTSSGASSKVNSKVKFTRSLTCYMEKEESLYNSKGTMKATYSGSEESYTVFYEFDMQIYVGKNSEGEARCLMCVKSFTLLQEDSSMRIKPSVVGKWVEIPREGAEILFDSIDAVNRDFLGDMQNYIQQIMNDEGDFKYNNDVYEYKNQENADNYLRVTFDLSDEESPNMEYVSRAKTSITNGTTYSTTNIESYVYDALTITNINNTVIKVKSKADIVCETVEDFEALFNKGE